MSQIDARTGDARTGDASTQDARTTQDGCVILPFVSPPQLDRDLDMDQSQVKTTSLAVLVAVTVLHDAKTSPEERLIELIEQSGEVEVLDRDEMLADFGLEDLDMAEDEPAIPIANDNAKLTAV